MNKEWPYVLEYNFEAWERGEKIMSSGDTFEIEDRNEAIARYEMLVSRYSAIMAQYALAKPNDPIWEFYDRGFDHTAGKRERGRLAF